MSRRLTWNAPEQARLVASDDPTRLRSGGADASCRGSNARGGGFAERGCSGQCDYVFGGTATEQRGGVRWGIKQ